MAIKAEIVTPPVVRNVTLTLDEHEAGLLMRYVDSNGNWTNDVGGEVASKVFYELARIGVQEA